MTYVVSDIHGNYEKFKELLKKINFGDDDLMYVLGDITDYGEESIPLLIDLSMRENVLPIAGECDIRALRLLGEFNKTLNDGSMPDSETIAEMTEWIHEGGAKTLEGFKALDADMREGVLDYLSDMALWEEVSAGGKTYVLVHAGIADFDPDADLDDCMPEDFTETPLDLDGKYYDDKTIIVGHVPTYTIEGAQRGRIYRGESVIDIDCGAAFGEALGAMRLEDGKEFYV
ncbi:MAG: metallophosphoesterase [Eubacteriales bacterium]